MPNDEFDPDQAKAEAAARHKGFYGLTRPRGRPTMPMDKRTRQASVTLQPQDFDTAKKLGGGNVSVGIRRALSLARTAPSLNLDAIEFAAKGNPINQFPPHDPMACKQHSDFDD